MHAVCMCLVKKVLKARNSGEFEYLLQHLIISYHIYKYNRYKVGFPVCSLAYQMNTTSFASH